MSDRRLGNGSLSRVQRGCLFVLLNDVVNLFAMDREFGWRLNPEFDRILIDAQDLNDDFSINDYAFIQFSG